MKLTKLSSNRLINVSVKSNIDWEKVVSKPQKLVKDFLYPYFQYDQIVEEFYIPGSKLRIDLFNIDRKIAIEISPDGYHVHYNPWLHKDRHKFLAKVNSDQDKRNWCKRNDIRLIELYDKDIKALSKEYIEEKYGISL